MRFRFGRHTVPVGRARLLWAFLSVMGCLAISRYFADSCYGFALETEADMARQQLLSGDRSAKAVYQEETDFVFGSPSAEAAKSSSEIIESTGNTAFGEGADMDQQEKKTEPAARLLFATDLHYLSPSLTDQGAGFQRLVEGGDGKLPERSEELLEELVSTAREIRPDALVLGGDLTYNGELQSLKEVCLALTPLLEEGIPVLVIPGNHDIAYPYACRYVGEKAYRVAAISQKEFAERCACFGPSQAISTCDASFSYMYELSEGLRLLFLDANTEKKPGRLDEETLRWADEQLEKARQDGAAVVTVTHQNVLRQSDLFYHGFVIGNETEAAELLFSHGIRTNFSGHSHIQHQAEKNGLTDYATGCMSVWPLHYSLADVFPDGTADYQVRELSGYQEEAKERFYVCTSRQVRQALMKLTIPDPIREAMIDYAVTVNGQYFAGRFSPEEIKESEGWKNWETYGKSTFWYLYIRSMI